MIESPNRQSQNTILGTQKLTVVLEEAVIFWMVLISNRNKVRHVVNGQTKISWATSYHSIKTKHPWLDHSRLSRKLNSTFYNKLPFIFSYDSFISRMNSIQNKTNPLPPTGAKLRKDYKSFELFISFWKVIKRKVSDTKGLWPLHLRKRLNRFQSWMVTLII